MQMYVTNRYLQLNNAIDYKLRNNIYKISIYYIQM